MKRKIVLKMISLLLSFAVLFSVASVYPSATTRPDVIGDMVKVDFIFAFLRREPTFSLINIRGILFKGREVQVLDYLGNYVHVQDTKTRKTGYVHSLLLNDKPFKVKQSYTNVYVGMLKNGAVTVNYGKEGNLDWSLSKSGIVEVTRYNDRSLSVKGISPGTVTLTVSCNGYKDTCDISCIDRWAETETASAQSDITLMGSPGKDYKGAQVIPKGATITARGSIPNNSNYLYVSSGDSYGFINRTDFPAIKYLMTQYHYYDEGYEKRFGSASTKIYDYASVLNDKMMELFELKICPYVSSYTSAADQCKIWRYGSKYLDNLSGSCPKNGNHKTDSCLKTGYLREELISRFGNGGGTVSKVAWTGHIMANHDNDRSNSTVGMGTIIVTPYKTVHKISSGYVNDSSYEIRRDSISTLMHETIHQLGVYDHYCYKDGKTEEESCSNRGCYVHKGNGVMPDCIMMMNKYPSETNRFLCSSCKSKIKNYLSNW